MGDSSGCGRYAANDHSRPVTNNNDNNNNNNDDGVDNDRQHTTAAIVDDNNNNNGNAAVNDDDTTTTTTPLRQFVQWYWRMRGGGCGGEGGCVAGDDDDDDNAAAAVVAAADGGDGNDAAERGAVLQQQQTHGMARAPLYNGDVAVAQHNNNNNSEVLTTAFSSTFAATSPVTAALHESVSLSYSYNNNNNVTAPAITAEHTFLAATTPYASHDVRNASDHERNAQRQQQQQEQQQQRSSYSNADRVAVDDDEDEDDNNSNTKASWLCGCLRCWPTAYHRKRNSSKDEHNATMTGTTLPPPHDHDAHHHRRRHCWADGSRRLRRVRRGVYAWLWSMSVRLAFLLLITTILASTVASLVTLQREQKLMEKVFSDIHMAKRRIVEEQLNIMTSHFYQDSLTIFLHLLDDSVNIESTTMSMLCSYLIRSDSLGVLYSLEVGSVGDGVVAMCARLRVLPSNTTQPDDSNNSNSNTGVKATRRPSSLSSSSSSSQDGGGNDAVSSVQRGSHDSTTRAATTARGRGGVADGEPADEQVVGGHSVNHSLAGYYFVNRRTMRYAEPRRLFSAVPTSRRNVTAFLDLLYGDDRYMAEFRATAATNPNITSLGGGTWYFSRQVKAMVLMFNVRAYVLHGPPSTRANSTTPLDTSVYLKARMNSAAYFDAVHYDKLHAAAMSLMWDIPAVPARRATTSHGNESVDRSRSRHILAVSASDDEEGEGYEGGGGGNDEDHTPQLRMLANNWGQQVSTSIDPISDFDMDDTSMLLASNASHPLMRAALPRIRWRRLLDGADADTVMFTADGVRVMASAWRYTTPVGHTSLLLVVNKMGQGAQNLRVVRVTTTTLLCVVIVALTCLLWLATELMLSRPLRLLAGALVHSAYHTHRDRALVDKAQGCVRIREIEQLLAAYNDAIRRLRTLDAFLPPAMLQRLHARARSTRDDSCCSSTTCADSSVTYDGSGSSSTPRSYSRTCSSRSGSGSSGTSSTSKSSSSCSSTSSMRRGSHHRRRRRRGKQHKGDVDASSDSASSDGVGRDGTRTATADTTTTTTTTQPAWLLMRVVRRWRFGRRRGTRQQQQQLRQRRHRQQQQQQRQQDGGDGVCGGNVVDCSTAAAAAAGGTTMYNNNNDSFDMALHHTQEQSPHHDGSNNNNNQRGSSSSRNSTSFLNNNNSNSSSNSLHGAQGVRALHSVTRVITMVYVRLVERYDDEDDEDEPASRRGVARNSNNNAGDEEERCLRRTAAATTSSASLPRPTVRSLWGGNNNSNSNSGGGGGVVLPNTPTASGVAGAAAVAMPGATRSYPSSATVRLLTELMLRLSDEYGGVVHTLNPTWTTIHFASAMDALYAHMAQRRRRGRRRRHASTSASAAAATSPSSSAAAATTTTTATAVGDGTAAKAGAAHHRHSHLPRHHRHHHRRHRHRRRHHRRRRTSRSRPRRRVGDDDEYSDEDKADGTGAAGGAGATAAAAHDVEVAARQAAAERDAVAAVRFALELQRQYIARTSNYSHHHNHHNHNGSSSHYHRHRYDGGGGRAPRLSILVDTTTMCRWHCHCRAVRQNFYCTTGRDVSRDVSQVLPLIDVDVAMTEETAVHVWSCVRQLPLEALYVGTPDRIHYSVVLYAALQGSVHEAAWVYCANGVMHAFLCMLHGDYDAALNVLTQLEDSEYVTAMTTLLQSGVVRASDTRVVLAAQLQRLLSVCRDCLMLYNGVPYVHHPLSNNFVRLLDGAGGGGGGDGHAGATTATTATATATTMTAAAAATATNTTTMAATLSPKQQQQQQQHRRRRRERRRRRPRREARPRRRAHSAVPCTRAALAASTDEEHEDEDDDNDDSDANAHTRRRRRRRGQSCYTPRRHGHHRGSVGNTTGGGDAAAMATTTTTAAASAATTMTAVTRSASMDSGNNDQASSRSSCGDEDDEVVVVATAAAAHPYAYTPHTPARRHAPASLFDRRDTHHTATTMTTTATTTTTRMTDAASTTTTATTGVTTASAAAAAALATTAKTAADATTVRRATITDHMGVVWTVSGLSPHNLHDVEPNQRHVCLSATGTLAQLCVWPLMSLFSTLAGRTTATTTVAHTDSRGDGADGDSSGDGSAAAAARREGGDAVAHARVTTAAMYHTPHMRFTQQLPRLQQQQQQQQATTCTVHDVARACYDRDRYLDDLHAAAQLFAPCGMVCPYIINTMGYSYDVKGGLAVLYEYYPGGTLRDVTKLYGCSLPRAAIPRCLLTIFSALGFLHSCKLVHGRLCPENVIVGTDCCCKLMGFFNNYTLAQQLLALPPLSYMSPEVAAGATPTPASDIYVVGLLLIEMMTGGRLPWRWSRKVRDTRSDAQLVALCTQHREQFASELRAGNVEVDVSYVDARQTVLCDLLAQCLHTDPARRITAADAVDLLSDKSDDIS